MPQARLTTEGTSRAPDRKRQSAGESPCVRGPISFHKLGHLAGSSSAYMTETEFAITNPLALRLIRKFIRGVPKIRVDDCKIDLGHVPI